MSSERRIEKLDATDDELARHLEDAELPALLLAVSHLTGDPGVLEGAPRPAQGRHRRRARPRPVFAAAPRRAPRQ